jgi:hypothetical protein
MVAATALKNIVLRPPSMACLPTEFHKNLPIGSEVDWGGGAETHTQDGDLISLHFSFRKESRLKT